MKTRSFVVIGLVCCAPLLGQLGGFGGPSILSRGTGGVGQQSGPPISFSPYLGASASYNLMLNTQSAEPTPSFTAGNTFGVRALAGLSAVKLGRRSSTSAQIGLSYGRNMIANNAPRTNAGGFLSLAHSRQLSRRTSWFLGANLRATNNFFQRGAFQGPDDLTGDPTADSAVLEEDLFDTRLYTGSVATGVSFQKSNRLAFSLQAGAFGTERVSVELQDVRGFQGSGSMQYSLTRRTYTGVQYQYGTFYFPGRYGESRYMTAQGFIGRRFSNVWSGQIGGGPLRLDSTRVRSVPIDPFIAELTGQSTALEIVDQTLLTFAGQGMLMGKFRDSALTILAGRTLMPGNGVYQTSISDRISASYMYRLARSVNLNFAARAMQMSAKVQDLRVARTYTVGVATGYRLTDSLNVSGGVRMIRTYASGGLLRRGYLAATVGIFYSPGELPFQIF